MPFVYPATVAWDRDHSAVVFNTTFYVYAVGDTSFTTPLPITNSFGVPMAALNSGNQGIFPEFQQATNATVVISDQAHTWAWTVIAIQPPTQDSNVAAFVGNPASQTAAAMRASFAGKWQPNTDYTAGTQALNPSGGVVICTVNHTSTGTYDSTKWLATASGLRWRGNWAATTAYEVNDVFWANAQSYVVITAHTSGTGPPSAAGPWSNLVLLSQAATGGLTAPSGSFPVWDVVQNADGTWPGGTATTWSRPDGAKDKIFNLVGSGTFPTAVASGTGGPLIGWDYITKIG